MPLTSILAAYTRALASKCGPGESAFLRRNNDPRYYVVQVAFPPPIIQTDLAGGVQQGRKVAIVLGASVVASGFPLPFVELQDTIVISSRAEVISSVEERRFQGVVVAYELELEGA